MFKKLIIINGLSAFMLLTTACATTGAAESLAAGSLSAKVTIPAGMPAIDANSAIYEVPVNANVSYQDVVDSLKSISEGKNFVNPANFPIGDHMKIRGQTPAGVLEVRAFCNLGLGAEIMLDHPEFVVFAPCRIALYEKPVEKSGNKKLQLFLALDRPTFDLQSIKNPTVRAQKAAVELESSLLDLMDKARKGDF